MDIADSVTVVEGPRTGAEVTSAVADGIATITIRRPDTMNSITTDVLDDLADLLLAAADEPTARVVALRGEGRAFCSGADLSTVADAAPEPLMDGAERLVHTIRDLPLPVVAVVQGPCAGFGVSIALAADLAYASSRAFFMLAFTKVGLMPDGGASALVAAAVGRQTALRMALLGERVTAPEAAALGLVAGVHEPDDLEDVVAGVLSTLASGPRVALARTKESINAATLGALDDALALERAGQVALLEAADFSEGVAAFTEKRSPVFTDTP